MVCDELPAGSVPVLHASVIMLPDWVWAEVPSGEPAGNVLPGTSVAVCAKPSELTKRIVDPTATAICAGAYPPVKPNGLDAGACVVRLTSMTAVVSPPEDDGGATAPGVHAVAATTASAAHAARLRRLIDSTNVATPRTDRREDWSLRESF